MVGMEAAAMGVPAAGFRVGGIPDWLTEGVNGALANANPPSSSALADAILRCIATDAHLARLRQGARDKARSMTLARHYEELMQVFAKVTSQPKQVVSVAVGVAHS